jgi:predicted dehydrogenase
VNQSTVRLGYIGLGRFSRNRIMPNLAKTPGVELVVVANSSEESSQSAARDFGFQRTARDWREVVEAPDVDAVIMGTRTDMHYEMYKPVLEAGKHLLMMNAMTRTVQEAQEMVRAAEERPDLITLVFPGQYYLREDAVMRHYLDSGYAGRILQVFDYWSTPFFGLGSQFEVASRWFGDHTRMFGQRKAFPPDTPLRQPARMDRAEGRPEANTVLGELASGASIIYLHNNAGVDTDLTRIEVHGSEGLLICYAQGQKQSGIYGSKGNEAPPEPLPIPEHLQASLTEGLPIEADFIAAVRGDHPPSPSIPRFRDGLKLLEFADGWRASSQSGTWYDLPS